MVHRPMLWLRSCHRQRFLLSAIPCSHCGYLSHHGASSTRYFLGSNDASALFVLPTSSTSSSKRYASNYTIATDPFKRLVKSLKLANQTCTVIESSCGGLISAALMGVPGSSAVYFGGTVAYNTKKSGRLLCGDEELHKRLLNPSQNDDDDMLLDDYPDLSQEARNYIKLKLYWTRETALKYCQHVGTDFAIAEGGATGPTFRPKGLTTGFAVLAVAGRKGDGDVHILTQKIVRSTHANRQANMRLFADCAAELCTEALTDNNPSLNVAKVARDTIAMNLASDSGSNYSGMHLDRSSQLRSDAEQMDRLYKDTNALHIVIRGNDEVMFATQTELALPTLETIIQNGGIEGQALERRTFLGRLGHAQTPVFAIFLPKSTLYSDEDSYFASTRAHAPMLDSLYNELALTATAYANWQKSHQFCNICGSKLEYIYGGTVRTNDVVRLSLFVRLIS